MKKRQSRKEIGGEKMTRERKAECCCIAILIPKLTFYANLIKSSNYVTTVTAHIPGPYQAGRHW
jgi:hypothetical protein